MSTEYGKEPMIPCPKCGEMMKLNARCCIRCGELNYLNHKNDSVKGAFNLGKKIKERELKKAAKKEAKKKMVNGEDVSFKNRSKRYVFFRRLTDLIITILIILAVINYKSLINVFNDFRANYYIKQVDKIVEQIETEFNEKECVSNELTGELTYSFEYSSDYFRTGISLYTFNYFRGYVKVFKTPDGNKYYVSISDGKYGFTETAYEELNKDSIKEIEPIDLPTNTITCN